MEWYVIVGLVCTVVIAMIAVGGVAWKSRGWFSSVDHNLSGLKEAAETDRQSLKESSERCRTDLTTLSGEVRTDIKRILLLLSPRKLVETNSPYRLTSLGESMAEKLEADEWATETARILLPQVKLMEEYQIDDYCREYVRDHLAPEVRTKTSRTAYKEGYDPFHVEAVLVVVLRNKLLSMLPD